MSNIMTFQELSNAVKGKILFNFSQKKAFTGVAIDSREVTNGCLFVPLRGENQDGHIYITQALEKGAVCFLVDTQYAKKNFKSLELLTKKYSACCIEVTHNLYALQDAAKAYLLKFPNLLKIAITGSSGKTTTKEIIASILKQKYNTIFSKGNYNSETGLPLSVFNIQPEHEVAVFELGMNRVGEIAELARIFNPNISVITNIGTAHIGILGSVQKIIEEKKQVFSQFSENCVGFIPDDNFADELKNVKHGQVFTVSTESIKKLSGIEDLGLKGFKLIYDNCEMFCHLTGAHNLKNILMGIAVAEYLKLNSSIIKAGLEQVTPLFGRTQLVYGKVNYLLDCYNANPDSTKAVLSFFSDLHIPNRKIIVLGSMLELGEFSNSAHIDAYKLALNSDAERIYLYGDDITNAYESSSLRDDRVVSFNTSEFDLLQNNFSDFIKENDFVLLKGSRGMQLERLENILKGEIV